MNLRELLEEIDYVEAKGNLDREIHDITHDSRKAGKGIGFTAIKGENRDGHSYIKDLVEKGTDIIFYEEDQEAYPETAAFIKLKDSRKYMADIAAAIHGYPSRGFELFGVTGTNGKTSTTYIIDHLLSSCGKKVATIGTNGVNIFGKNEKLENTTPESSDLQKIFRRFADAGVEEAVMEVSSHALDLHRVRMAEFDYGIFTNLTMEHLDFHGDMESYYYAKKQLFDQVQKSAVINIDDPYGERLFYELKKEGKDVKSFGKEGDYSIRNLSFRKKAYSFDLSLPDKTVHSMEIKSTALFTVYNIVGALSICCEAGFPIDLLIEAAGNFKGAEGRYESIENDLGFDIVIDYAHTPDALKNLLETAAGHKGRTILVFGVSGDRRKDIREEMGRIAGKYSDYAIVTMDDPKKDTVENINRDIVRGLDSVSGKYECIEDRKKAVEKGIDLCKPGDLLFFAGKGHERFMKIGEEKVPFDERELIKEYLKKK
ncbi:MAG: UDP-N-acetylmuramoyl-L-alanyl-D-glutamate--2,6-diaminopimelate ligase [Gallicola sp.]|nr:UDP-N-acetylmuramoyl-L-alanyl-D-glutamate--2,6-diaminopimelate ligase [Gallicola sp.]